VYIGDRPTFRRNISPPSSGQKCKLSTKAEAGGSLLDLLFDPEEGGDIFLRNVGISMNYTAVKTILYI
jgi:hypothetical protein